MIKNYIYKFNDVLDDKFLFIIIIITILLSIIKINLLPISLTIDSYGYVEYSDNLFPVYAWQSRPIGYAIFLKVARLIPFFGLTLVIFFQILLYIFASVFIYLTFRKYNSLIAFIFTLIFSFTPAFQWINNNILADALYTFLPIFVVFYLFKYFDNQKNSYLYLIFFLAFIVALNRPSYLVFFYIIIFINIFFFFFKKNINNFNISKFFLLKLTILSFLFLSLFNIINSNFSKNYAFHQLWIWNISTSMCGEEKCFNINNGVHAKKYFDVLPEIISTDKYFKEVLSSKYDYKDSPLSIDESLYKLKPDELLKKIHLSTRHTPFVHIYGFMVNNIGFEETHKIIRNASIETFLNHPSLIFGNILSLYKFKNFFNTDIKKSSQVFKEGLYFGMLPKPHKTLKKQGLTHFEKISPKEYSQYIFGLERFTGETFKNYYKNDKKFYELYKKMDNYTFVKEKYYEDKNYAFISLYFLAYMNLFFLIFYKVFILIILPIYSVILLVNLIIKRSYSEKDFVYFFSLLIFYSIIVTNLILSPNNMDKKILMNLTTLFPLIIIFTIDIFERFTKKFKIQTDS